MAGTIEAHATIATRRGMERRRPEQRSLRRAGIVLIADTHGRGYDRLPRSDDFRITTRKCSADPEATNYRLRWPFTIFFTLRFCDPRATSAARLAFGATFLRAARLSFLRSSLSVTFVVFIRS